MSGRDERTTVVVIAVGKREGGGFYDSAQGGGISAATILIPDIFFMNSVAAKNPKCLNISFLLPLKAFHLA